MQVTSGTVALALLKGQTSVDLAAKSSIPTKTIPPVSAPVVGNASTLEFGDSNAAAFFESSKMLESLTIRTREMLSGLSNGSVSPFDPEFSKTWKTEEVFHQNKSDLRLQFEGRFAAEIISTNGQTAPQRDANFPSRRDAMANAYHFATELSQKAQSVVASKPLINASTDSMGRLYGMGALGGAMDSFELMDEAYAHGTDKVVFDIRAMETAAAALAKLFSFDSTSVTVAAYDGQFSGFSISHGTQGKIMDVDQNGAFTLYDAGGTAYSAEEYNAAKIDGGIPQLHNDIIRREPVYWPV